MLVTNSLILRSHCSIINCQINNVKVFEISISNYFSLAYCISLPSLMSTTWWWPPWCAETCSCY